MSGMCSWIDLFLSAFIFILYLYCVCELFVLACVSDVMLFACLLDGVACFCFLCVLHLYRHYPLYESLIVLWLFRRTSFPGDGRLTIYPRVS